MKETEILYLIPARGGSKRIVKKNIAKLNNRPMIAYSIEGGLYCGYGGRVFVSTDDKEIEEVSRNWGAEIIKRPDHLAKDDTPMSEVIEQALAYLKIEEDYKPDIIVLLQPTSPLRSKGDIYDAIVAYLKNGADCLWSVGPQIKTPYHSLIIKNKYALPLFDWKYFSERTQVLQQTYAPNGAIYIFSRKYFEKHKSVYSKTKTMVFKMPRERSVDVDTEDDLLFAEFLIRKDKLGIGWIRK